MKKILLLLGASVLTLTSCMNDHDAIEVQPNAFTAQQLPATNTTISQVRTQYKSAIDNNNYEQVKDDQVFEGIVVANDLSGNIYQYVYLQGLNDDGTLQQQGGIGLGIKGMGCLYTILPVGQRVRVNLKDLYVGGYGASPRIGLPYINTNGAMRLGPMTLPYLASNVELVGKPEPEKVVARVLTGEEIKNTTNLSSLTPMLVKLEKAVISDAGWPFAHWEVGGDTYSEYHDITVGSTKVSQLLYTSTSASFAGDTIQPGVKTIYGLLNRYNNTPQLSLRSLDDITD